MRLITIVFLLTSTFISWSQSTADTTFLQEIKQNKLQSGVVFEVGYQNATFASLGGIVGSGFGLLRQPSIGFGACIDVIYNGTTAYFGPRVFGGINFSDFFGFRIGAANYMREKNTLNDFRLLAELCFTVGGRFGLNAGFSLPVLAKNYSEIGNFKVGVTVNLAK